MNRTSTFFRWMAAALLCLQLAACGSLFPKGTRVDWSELTLSAAPNANQNSPVAVDVVMVLDDAMLGRLTELTAAKWFGAPGAQPNTIAQNQGGPNRGWVAGATPSARRAWRPCSSSRTTPRPAPTASGWKTSRAPLSPASTFKASTCRPRVEQPGSHQ